VGRRAVRKIDPALDLSQHLTTLEALPQPLHVPQLFCEAQPLEIEVGCGKGMFLVRASEIHPGRNFLGCEVARKYAHYAAAQLARRQRANALVVHGDARRLFTQILPSGCAAAVHVYFPDPWWKKRHLRRRIMNEQFVVEIERVLQPLGILHFWTDVADYYHATLEVIASATGLQGPCPVTEQPAEHDLDYRTHFERRMRMHGQLVWRSQFLRGPSTSDVLHPVVAGL
jgi:tRNA (guanine-N7-)-methyltransferase